MSGPSSSGGPRSNSMKGSLASSSSEVSRPHWGGLCMVEWTGLSSGKALQCLLLCPWDLLLHGLWLWEWMWVSGWPLVMDQLNLSIFPSNMMVAARALQWASLASASSLLAEVPHLTLHGVLSHIRWVSASSDSSYPLSCFPPSTSGGFSKRPPHPWSVHVSVWVCTAEIPAIS